MSATESERTQMSMPLYRERQAGPPARSLDSLPTNTKRGLIAMLTGALDSDQLAEAFPEQCNDGNGICGTNHARARSMMEAFVAGFEWPPTEDDDDGIVFDLLEFFVARIATPKSLHWHSYFSHYELGFDKPGGARQFREEVNAMLRAGRTVFELTQTGRIERVGTPEVESVLVDLRPNTGDADLDTLLIDARQHYLSPKQADRQAGLEKLWDGFERLKTIEDGKDKKAQIVELLNHVDSAPLRAEVDTEMAALTKIGNEFRIRHHETSKHAVPDSHARDYLFARLGNLIIYLLKVSDRLDSQPS